MFIKNTFILMKNLSSVLRLKHSCSNVSPDLGLITTVEKSVDLFSKISFELPIHVKIVPVDLNVYPSGDKLVVSLLSNVIEKAAVISIKQSANNVEIIGKDFASPNAMCLIRAPTRASFDIKGVGLSDITIKGMHSDECNVRSSGCIKLNDINGKSINVHSDKGSVICEGTLKAEKIDIRTEAVADVICEHIRANTFNVNTYGGKISVESCYCDKSNFTSVMGDVKLSNVHRNCTVEILDHGELNMTGFDGTVNAILKRGNVSFQASRLEHKNSIFVHEAGNVDIMLPDSLSSTCVVDVISRQLSVEDTFLKHGIIKEDNLYQKFKCVADKSHEDENELVIDCRNCSVNLRVFSWKKMIEKQMTDIVKR